jgi:DNA-binding MarR family transcriptional regulator
MTVGELAKAEHVSSPMVTKIAKGLEEEGLVTRTADPTDKRVTNLAITKDGERRLERSRSRKNAWLARNFEGLSPEELTAIEAVIPVLERLTSK